MSVRTCLSQSHVGGVGQDHFQVVTSPYGQLLDAPRTTCNLLTVPLPKNSNHLFVMCIFIYFSDKILSHIY